MRHSGIRGASLDLLALFLLAGGLAAALQGQAAPPVRDQNASGSPQRAQKAPPTDAAILAYQGMQAFEKQDYATAIARFGQALSQNPEDTGSRFYMALSLSLTGKDAASLPHYEKLVEAQPGIYELRLNYAQALGNTKRFEEAAAQLAMAEELKPGQAKTAELLVATGLAELAAGDDAGARKRFAAVLAGNPGSAEALHGMGRATLKAGDIASAEEWFRKAAAIEPSYKEALLEMAGFYEKEGHFEKAITLYGEFPENAGAKGRAGELLLELGKAKEAIASLEERVKAEPTFANREALAVACLRSGDPARAEEQARLAVEAEPENLQARALYARILRDSRKFGPAAEQFSQIIRRKPGDAMAWSEFAGVAVMAEQYQAAFEALAQVEKLGAMKPGHHYLRAILLDRFGNDDPAIAEYELFLAASNGQNGDEEFKARQRVRLLKNKKKR